ncbi:hypothetical protein Tco_0767608 [Tanacetum coccineum]
MDDPIGFARALIEVSSNSDLKREVIMAIPNEEGIGISRKSLEWCTSGSHHIVYNVRVLNSPTTCPNRVKEVVPKAALIGTSKPRHIEDKEEGFVEVKGRKKKGKTGSNQHCQMSGIKPSKPKPNFQYRLFSKQGKDMDDASNLGANDPKEGSSSQTSIAKASIKQMRLASKHRLSGLKTLSLMMKWMKCHTPKEIRL